MNRIITIYKNAYSGLSPAAWWLSVVMLVNRAGTMVLPFLTLYLTETKGYSIAKAGTVMSCFGLGAVCGGFLGGKLTDKLGFYNIQVAALLCGGVMFIMLGQMETYPSICLFTFLLAMLNDSFRPANATAIAAYSKEENRTRSYSLNRLSINVGWAIGGAAGGFIASKNYQLLFWIDGLTNISAAMLLILVLSPGRNSQTLSHKQAANLPPASSVYKDRIYLVFILLTVLFGCSFFQIFATLPVFLKQKLFLSPNFIGLVMALNGLLIAVFEMAVVFSLEPLNKHIQFIAFGTLLVGASFVMFNIFPGRADLAIATTVVVTLGEMLSMPFMNTFWINRTEPGNRGQYAGLYTAAWSIAQITGPYAGTQVAQHFGYHALWWVVGGVSIVTALGFRWLRHNHRKSL